MSSSRKGQSEEVVKWVIAIVGLLVIALVIFQLKEVIFDDPYENMECYSQIKVHAKLANLTEGIKSTPITCPTKREPVDKGTPDDEVNKRLAEDMRQCWDNWGGGDYLLFEEDGRYCHLCSFIQFEDETGTVEGFYDFLNEKKTKKGVKYINYFAPRSSTPVFDKITSEEAGKYYRIADESNIAGEDFAKSGDGFTIDKSQNYAVIFYYIRGDKYIKDFIVEINQDDFKKTAGFAGGAIVGFIAGRAAGALVCMIPGVGYIGCAIAGASTILIGTSGGAIIGFFTGKEPPQYASFLMLVPLNENEIDKLGCEYSYAERR